MPRGAAIATENFSAALSGANWSQLNLFWSTAQATGGTGSATSSNTDAQAAARWIGAGAGTFTKAQWAAGVIGALGFLSSTFSTGVILSATADQDTSVQNTRDFYFLEIQADSSGPNYTTRVGKFVNGTLTAIAAAAMPWVNGDIFSMERLDNDALIPYRNATPLGGVFAAIGDSDAALAGAGTPGFLANGSAPTIDNWSAGNMVTAVDDPIVLPRFVGLGINFYGNRR